MPRAPASDTSSAASRPWEWPAAATIAPALHRVAQALVPQRPPEQRLRDEDQRIRDGGGLQVAGRRRALRVGGPRERGRGRGGSAPTPGPRATPARSASPADATARPSRSAGRWATSVASSLSAREPWPANVTAAGGAPAARRASSERACAVVVDAGATEVTVRLAPQRHGPGDRLRDAAALQRDLHPQRPPLGEHRARLAGRA